MKSNLLAVFGSIFALASCTASTGSDIVTFQAYAAGPSSAVQDQAFVFTNAQGFEVSLTKAKLHIGALYLNRSIPVLGAQDTSCILPGQYVAELTEGIDLDALSPQPQAFPSMGHGTADPALAGEVWLTGGRIDKVEDKTIILDVTGTAKKDGEEFPFDGLVTISKNRLVSTTDPASPGANPICKQRIVSPISVNITPQNGGHLLLRVDPSVWFAQVDFSKLEKVSESPALYRFRDDLEGAPNLALYQGLRAIQGAYRFEWLIP